jgi:hypothetical protein
MGFSKLSPFQREVLEAVFSREQGFFLTGGAAVGRVLPWSPNQDDLDLS